MKKLTLDKLNKKLISELQQNGRVKFTTLARKFNLTPAAIKERIERLVDNQLIKPTVLVSSKLFPLGAVVGVEADPECVNILLKKLSSCPLVVSLSRTSGTHNLILNLRVENFQSLESFLNTQIRSEPGIKHVEVNICNSVLPEFQPVKICTSSKILPCGLEKGEKKVCVGCPAVEHG